MTTRLLTQIAFHVLIAALSGYGGWRLWRSYRYRWEAWVGMAFCGAMVALQVYLVGVALNLWAKI